MVEVFHDLGSRTMHFCTQSYCLSRRTKSLFPPLTFSILFVPRSNRIVPPLCPSPGSTQSPTLMHTHNKPCHSNISYIVTPCHKSNEYVNASFTPGIQHLSFCAPFLYTSLVHSNSLLHIESWLTIATSLSTLSRSVREREWQVAGLPHQHSSRPR